jgi:hypothetical protein
MLGNKYMWRRILFLFFIFFFPIFEFTIVENIGWKKTFLVKKTQFQKNCQICILGSHCVAKNIEGWLNICTFISVHSQIWLNLFRDDCHFAYNQKLLAENTDWNPTHNCFLTSYPQSQVKLLRLPLGFGCFCWNNYLFPKNKLAIFFYSFPKKNQIFTKLLNYLD